VVIECHLERRGIALFLEREDIIWTNLGASSHARAMDCSIYGTMT
jgi:hypothetical protein